MAKYDYLYKNGEFDVASFLALSAESNRLKNQGKLNETF